MFTNDEIALIRVAFANHAARCEKNSRDPHARIRQAAAEDIRAIGALRRKLNNIEPEVDLNTLLLAVD